MYTKEVLIEELKKYRRVLSSNMNDYLDDILNLEYSVLRENIGSDERDALSQLKIYKAIAKYNIYHRAIMIGEKLGLQSSIADKNYGFNIGLNIITPDDCEKATLFNFDYFEKTSINKKPIPQGYRTDNIGKISLFQMQEDIEAREKKIDDVLERLVNLQYAQNPYYSNLDMVGGPSATWELNRQKKIESFEERLKDLENKEHITEKEKKCIELSNEFIRLMLEDYGLSEDDFTEVNNSGLVKNIYLVSSLRKTYVKKLNNITVEKSIKLV